MRTGSRSNALLVELLIVIMFFMIASTLLIRIFTGARRMSARAERITVSLAEAQNIADQLYAAEDAGSLLESLGFVRQETGWVFTAEDYQMEAYVTEEGDEYGVYRHQEIRVTADGETLFSLPCSRWQGVSE